MYPKTSRETTVSTVTSEPLRLNTVSENAMSNNWTEAMPTATAMAGRRDGSVCSTAATFFRIQIEGLEAQVQELEETVAELKTEQTREWHSVGGVPKALSSRISRRQRRRILIGRCSV